jgi:hypothetical protein
MNIVSGREVKGWQFAISRPRQEVPPEGRGAAAVPWEARALLSLGA